MQIIPKLMCHMTNQVMTNSIRLDLLLILQVEISPSNIISNKNQSIDEAMVAYRGKYSAKQYIPSKPTKSGCDTTVRPVTTFIMIYTWEKKLDNNGKGLGHRVVENLTQDLHKRNNHVYFDRCFTFVALIQDFLINGVYACSRVRQNRKEFQQDLKSGNIPRLQSGKFIS